MSQFRIDSAFLIPTRLEVKGIAHFPVTMLGALFLEVSSGGMCTRQIVYIAHEARSLILSETALKALGGDPGVVGTTQREGDVVVAAVRTLTKNSCGYPLRTECPPLPVKIPCAKPELNRSLLKQWILQHQPYSQRHV